MSQHYLLKDGASPEYSFADLLRDSTTEWEVCVSNPAAVKAKSCAR